MLALVPDIAQPDDEWRRRCVAIAPCLPWVESVVRTHPEDADLAELGWLFLRRAVSQGDDPLLEAVAALPCFLAALVTHVAQVNVAEHALRALDFLTMLDDMVSSAGVPSQVCKC